MYRKLVPGHAGTILGYKFGGCPGISRDGLVPACPGGPGVSRDVLSQDFVPAAVPADVPAYRGTCRDIPGPVPGYAGTPRDKPVCMYVCMFVWVYVYVRCVCYIYMYLCMYVCMCVCTYASIYVSNMYPPKHASTLKQCQRTGWKERGH